ncbi:MULTISPECIES: hypothetical protein [Bacillales]|uniref:hypothetical protein n=1 Tax=Bacillales TaxID=1385 RepID=UPI00036A2042|nr:MULTISPECIES: hypothetical protein [Bacillales]KMZ41502.1 hypothetical protein AC624_10565 [Bacillus sp. FJAT-27238]
MNINMKRYLSVLLMLSVLLNMVVPLSYASTNLDNQMNTVPSENISSDRVESTTEIEGEGYVDGKLPVDERNQENEEDLETENESYQSFQMKFNWE